MAAKQSRRDFAAYWGVGWMLGIMVIGLLALSSALPPDQQTLWWRQILWFAVGSAVTLGISRVDYRWLQQYAVALLAAVIGLLILVKTLGVVGGGSQRWLSLGPINLQPSEFAKLSIVIWVAAWCAARPRPQGAGLLQLAVPGTVILGTAGLIIAQPDLGTGLMVLCEGAAVLYVAGISRRLLVWLAGAGTGAAAAAWFFLLRPYQKRRIISFLQPESDPLGAGYHTIQSKIAVGNGGVWGTGFDQGTQAALHFLPEQHTDFIFSVWAEEWGFVGGLVVFGLFIGLLRWTMRTAIEARDTGGRLLGTGILAHFTLHGGINLAMALGLAPVVGIPLPWMTYGGSAVLLNCTAVGILISIRRRRHMFLAGGSTYF